MFLWNSSFKRKSARRRKMWPVSLENRYWIDVFGYTDARSLGLWRWQRHWEGVARLSGEPTDAAPPVRTRLRAVLTTSADILIEIQYSLYVYIYRHRCSSSFLLSLIILNESSSFDWSAIECSRLIDLCLSRNEISCEVSLKITKIRSIFLSFVSFLSFERKDFRDEIYFDELRDCEFVKTFSRIVASKPATRMKFDAVSSKAVGAISDYQQPRGRAAFSENPPS